MKKSHSLSAKATYSSLASCILFGLVAQIIALSFYAFTLTRQYINTADSTCKQTLMSATYRVDSAGYARQVMEVYHSLSDEERNTVGTPEYRGLYSGADDGSYDGTYEILMNMMQRILSYHTQNDISDLYMAMYDMDTSSVVYIIDPDENESTRFFPGDWEPVSRKSMLRFLEPEGSGPLYDISWTERYGIMCTVGTPVTDADGEICAFIFVDISLNDIISGMAGFALGFTVVLSFVTVFIAVCATRHIRKNIVRPIKLITDASVSFASGKKDENPSFNHFEGLDINTGDEIETLAHTMADMENDIKEFGKNLLTVTKEKERIGTELALATKIQAAMLPNKYPAFPDRDEFDIYASMHPAKEVGGDFYDFFLTDKDHLAIVIADVSGKGVPAALFMMISKLLINIFAKQESSPAKVLEEINNRICQKNTQEMFVTVWLGVLEISTGKLTAVNAGHEYPIIKKPGGEYELLKDKHGFVVGGMEDMKYREYELTLEKGSSLFLYTDGVPEATNADTELFGTDRLLGALNRSKDCDPKQLLTNVKSTVDEFVGEADQFDDLTMLGITIK